MTEIGPIPGRYNPSDLDNLVSAIFLPKLQQYLKENGLTEKISGNPLGCLNSTTCQTIMKRVVILLKTVEALYPPWKDDIYNLDKRPFLQLGRILSTFSDIVFKNYILIDSSKEFQSTVDDNIYYMMTRYFDHYANEMADFFDNSLVTLPHCIKTQGMRYFLSG